MSRRQIPLKSQYPTLLSELPVWVRRLAHFALIFGASILVANALVGENGLVDALEAGHRHRVLVDDLARLRLKNEQLREAANRLRDDPRAVEEVARGELGSIKSGELLLLFSDEPTRSR